MSVNLHRMYTECLFVSQCLSALSCSLCGRNGIYNPSFYLFLFVCESHLRLPPVCMPTKHTPNPVVAGTRARPDHKRQRCLNVCLLVFGGLIVEALVQLIPWQAAIGARGLSGRLVAGVLHHCGGIQRLSSGVCGAARLVPFAAQVCPSRAFVLVSSLFSYKETITRVSFMCVQSVKRLAARGSLPVQVTRRRAGRTQGC